MTGAQIAQLLIAIGPSAFTLIPELARVWKTELPPEEVLRICQTSRTTYEEYEARAKAELAAVASSVPTPVVPEP